MLAASQFTFERAGLIDQNASQPVASRATLAETQLNQAALPSEYLGRQLAAVFASHRTLDALDDGRHRRTVVFELLCAVRDLDARATADVFVIGALIGVLESAPAADVIDQNDLEVRAACLDVLDQLLQRPPPIDAQAALALVGIGANDFDVAPSRVLADLVGLVFRRILLVLGRHPHVLGGPKCRWLIRPRNGELFCLHRPDHFMLCELALGPAFHLIGIHVACNARPECTWLKLLPSRMIESPFGLEVKAGLPGCRSSHLLTHPSCIHRFRTAA